MTESEFIYHTLRMKRDYAHIAQTEYTDFIVHIEAMIDMELTGLHYSDPQQIKQLMRMKDKAALLIKVSDLYRYHLEIENNIDSEQHTETERKEV